LAVHLPICLAAFLHIAPTYIMPGTTLGKRSREVVESGESIQLQQWLSPFPNLKLQTFSTPRRNVHGVQPSLLSTMTRTKILRLRWWAPSTSCP
jgi:hypothetical protein